MRAIDITRDNPAPILITLIAAIPDDRLRDLVLELALRGAPPEAPAALATPAPAATPATRAPARRAPAKRTRAGWSKERRAAFERARAANGAAPGRPDYNTVRRERRAAERAAKAALPITAGNGHDHDIDEGISPEAFWAHARKLSPSPHEPWRSVVSQLGSSERTAREAERTMTLPFGVATSALARFLALPTKDTERAAAR